jgi:hypothetical protein
VGSLFSMKKTCLLGRLALLTIRLADDVVDSELKEDGAYVGAVLFYTILGCEHLSPLSQILDTLLKSRKSGKSDHE